MRDEPRPEVEAPASLIAWSSRWEVDAHSFVPLRFSDFESCFEQRRPSGLYLHATVGGRQDFRLKSRDRRQREGRYRVYEITCDPDERDGSLLWERRPAPHFDDGVLVHAQGYQLPRSLLDVVRVERHGVREILREHVDRLYAHPWSTRHWKLECEVQVLTSLLLATTSVLEGARWTEVDRFSHEIARKKPGWR